MPENNEFKETNKELDSSQQEKETTPLTKMLDEFLKDRPSGTVANAHDVLNKIKEDHEKLNDQMNPRYKRYDGRDALSKIENPPEIKVQTTMNEKGQPISVTNDKRDLNIEYNSDGTVQKITAKAKDQSNSPYWTEAELVSFEKQNDGSMIGMARAKDGHLYRSRGPLTDFEVSSKGNISYHDEFFGHKVKIAMDNSVTTYGATKSDEEWKKNPTPETFETTRRDGTKQFRMYSLDGAKLTIEGVPTTIYQDSDRVYGIHGIAPSAAVLQPRDGGNIVFLPNKDGTYLRAAFDPKGNLSTDVIFNKPLPRFMDELKNSKHLGVNWSQFDKGGVRFTMTGVPYSVMDNVDHYLDFKRDKGR